MFMRLRCRGQEVEQLAGKTAFITGGANGIGLGMAEVFSAAGMNVVIADIRKDHLERAVSDLAGKGFKVHPITLDVSDRAAMAAAAGETERVFGKVHLVCNNAGINLFKAMDECTYNDWDWVMGVNLGGVINGVVEFIPRLKKHGEGGHILNTASMASIISGPGAGIYTAAKFAVRGLSECLRYALAPHNIGVSVLCPGLVKSFIYDSNSIRPASLPGESSAEERAFLEMLPRMHDVGMEPREVAESALAGVRENRLYIFSHPEFKDEVREICEEMVAAFPDKEADPARLVIEDMRRKGKAAAKT
jgi:NAD(P)-dependent dehydrogenase (short-subunit alcohol dehydrogenase family)